ncbi:MAG: glycosyltransferase [Candidatus Woesearchaeota archaeon]
MNPLADYLFEISWEVCNKVGGIYTVLTSKTEQMQAHYKNYFLIGPYFEQHARIEFLESNPPEIFRQPFEELGKENIIFHYGRWDTIMGKPQVILVEFLGIVDKKNSLKGELWNDYGIDSIRGYWDFEEPMLWSYCIGRLLQKICDGPLRDKKVVAQFHEWMSSFGLLYLKKHNTNIATVFTTHATILGRTLSSNGVDLYNSLHNLDPLHEAYRFNIESKHMTERAAALSADVFTTVSEITGVEAEKFLSRKPEVLVYNGLDVEKFPGFEDISIKHRASREKIREFLTYYYFPYYTFDIEKNLLFYTLGRYEFHNKGYDILIKALGKLNERLKHENASDHTATCFFWIPMEQHGLKIELLENKNYYMHIKNYVNANGADILTRLIYDVISRKEGAVQDILTDGFMQDLRKDLLAFERKGSPPFSTHNLDEHNNELVQAFRHNGLLNRKEDMVKVIIEPVYLDGNDGFIDMNYYDAIVGCHLGLFPSYYEPWGYTPLEGMALGVPALTTDLSGFGLFAKNQNSGGKGIYILERLNKREDLIVDEFSSILYDFMKFNQSQRIEFKLNAKSFSNLADWKLFVEYYVNAHNIALQKKSGGA